MKRTMTLAATLAVTLWAPGRAQAQDAAIEDVLGVDNLVEDASSADQNAPALDAAADADATADVDAATDLDAAAAMDASAPGDATSDDLASPTDSAVASDSAVPGDADTADAGADDSSPGDSAEARDASAGDSNSTDHMIADQAQPDSARPDRWQPDSAVRFDVSGFDTRRPDAATADSGPCVQQCVDDKTLHACDALGRLVILPCPSDYVCQSSRCVALEAPPEDSGGCQCRSATPGGSPARAWLLSVTLVGLLAWRQKKRHA